MSPYTQMAQMVVIAEKKSIKNYKYKCQLQ